MGWRGGVGFRRRVREMLRLWWRGRAGGGRLGTRCNVVGKVGGFEKGQVKWLPYNPLPRRLTRHLEIPSVTIHPVIRGPMTRIEIAASIAIIFFFCIALITISFTSAAKRNHKVKVVSLVLSLSVFSLIWPVGVHRWLGSQVVYTGRIDSRNLLAVKFLSSSTFWNSVSIISWSELTGSLEYQITRESDGKVILAGELASRISKPDLVDFTTVGMNSYEFRVENKSWRFDRVGSGYYEWVVYYSSDGRGGRVGTPTNNAR